jgi:hypothetical protein
MEKSIFYYSDDYAGIYTGELDFYYGYENATTNNLGDTVWYFTVKKNGEVLFSMTSSEIEHLDGCNVSKGSDVRDYLLAGIATYLKNKQ